MLWSSRLYLEIHVWKAKDSPQEERDKVGDPSSVDTSTMNPSTAAVGPSKAKTMSSIRLSSTECTAVLPWDANRRPGVL